jgi:hypothetical protein
MLFKESLDEEKGIEIGSGQLWLIVVDALKAKSRYSTQLPFDIVRGRLNYPK